MAKLHRSFPEIMRVLNTVSGALATDISPALHNAFLLHLGIDIMTITEKKFHYESIETVNEFTKDDEEEGNQEDGNGLDVDRRVIEVIDIAIENLQDYAEDQDGERPLTDLYIIKLLDFASSQLHRWLSDYHQSACEESQTAKAFVIAAQLMKIKETLAMKPKVTDKDKEEIGRAVQQECRDRSRMPSSA
eukprot:TRINITY_DN12743_c0_g1_i1.p1 TRINITY_DN12743_c0_g1~~TRINITY_DN12743_c0_g1_i1.p1  ORF type:complete len:190 (-),score=38.78 TRINITY_DN12743_c0_g1_i1:11-580(-)